jgi:hypothetical protein
MLMFRVPTEPSALRVSTWRKLKRLGAIVLHDAVWVLPALATTREQLQWLAAEIAEGGGEATVWRALVEVGDDAALVAQFREHVDAVYAEILDELQRDAADVAQLARRYQQAIAQDYFHSSLGEKVRAALLATKGGED